MPFNCEYDSERNTIRENAEEQLVAELKIIDQC